MYDFFIFLIFFPFPAQMTAHHLRDLYTNVASGAGGGSVSGGGGVSGGGSTPGTPTGSSAAVAAAAAAAAASHQNAAALGGFAAAAVAAGGAHQMSGAAGRLLDLSAPLRYGMRPYDPIQMLHHQGAVSKLLGKKPFIHSSSKSQTHYLS